MTSSGIPSLTVILTIIGEKTNELFLELAIRSNDVKSGAQLLTASNVPEKLPAMPAGLLESLEEWEKSYIEWGKAVNFRAITLPANPQTNISKLEIEKCRQLDRLQEKIAEQLNEWLGEREISLTKQSIIEYVSPLQYGLHPQSLSLIVQTRIINRELNLKLQKLPWSEWRFIRDKYPSSGVALSNKATKATVQQKGKLKALVICGSYQDPKNRLNTTSDKSNIEKYLREHVDLDILECSTSEHTDYSPKRALFAKLEQVFYDLIFFCGHSSENNQIHLNDTESISIDDRRFRSLLGNMKQKGLILVFLNSCHSLGTAGAIEDIGIPLIIAMKSAVSDENAQKFILEFLRRVTQPHPKPVHVAVEEARLVLNDDSPRGGLLPVLIQNPEQPCLYLRKKSSGKVLVSMFCIGAITALVVAATQFLSSRNPTSICDYAVGLAISRISCGGDSFRSGPLPDDLQQGFDLFKKQDYKGAVESFTRDPQSMYSNPMAWIAANNAKIELNAKLDRQQSKTPKQVKTIVATVPISGGKEIEHAVVDPLKGIAFAQAEWNDGENPWSIRVVVVDDQNNGKYSEDLIRQIAKHQDVLAILGHYSSTVTSALMSIYVENKVDVISYASTADKLSSQPYFFRIATENNHDAEQIAKYWAKDYNNFAIFHSAKSGVYSKSMRDAFKKALGQSKNIVGEFELGKIENDKIDIDKVLAKAGAILIFSDANTVDKELAGVANVINNNKGRLPIMGNPLLEGICGGAISKINSKSEVLTNVTFVSSISMDDSRYIKDEQGRSIIAEMRKKWKGEWIGYKLINTYDAMQVIITAAKNAENREDFHREISNQKFSARGITPKISFDGSNRKEKMTSFIEPRQLGAKCVHTTRIPK
jgi:branched-chain amino acid transport system substrate-binding protein